MKSVRTPKGTELPLMSLKGKAYLMVAYRIQWFNEVEDNFQIETTLVKAEKDESVVTAKVTVFDKTTGKVVKSTSATKREDSKGFPDHLEKAETGAIGRALALLGYGTQFAISDLDEGTRLADSPLQPNETTSGFSKRTIETIPLALTIPNEPINVTGSDGKTIGNISMGLPTDADGTTTVSNNVSEVKTKGNGSFRKKRTVSATEENEWG